MIGLLWRRKRAAEPVDASRALARAHHGCVREIHATFEGTILALGQALELRDYETQGHTERVVAWTDRLTLTLGLTEAERRAIRWGAFLHDETLDVVRYHHERWDGGGYPDGLSSKDIPVHARVFAVVDVWDALTHRRPYKEPWARSDARAEIERGAGTQFDPAVAHRFLELEAVHASVHGATQDEGETPR